MAKLTKLILPLADVISPEKEALAEKWILREAYQLNCGVLQKQITKEKKDDVRQAMREKLLSHEESIRELNEFFKTAYFFPTEKDIRIMQLVARANTGERDFGRRTGNVDWGNSSSHILAGYKDLADAMLEVSVYLTQKKPELPNIQQRI